MTYQFIGVELLNLMIAYLILEKKKKRDRETERLSLHYAINNCNKNSWDGKF